MRTKFDNCGFSRSSFQSYEWGPQNLKLIT